MTFTKLTLSGHIHGRPKQKIQSSHSWPEGLSLDEVLKYVSNFEKSFSLEKAEMSREP